jgi:hypothetical protein
LVFERSGPDARIVESIWALLPASERIGMWPATFHFGGAEAFDLVVVPPKCGPDNPRYLNEEQAGDYPEGRYELAMQIAVDNSRQSDIDALLTRRTRRQSFALSLALLFAIVSALLVPAALSLLAPERPPATTAAMDLEPADKFPRLSEEERKDLDVRLQQLGRRLNKPLPAGNSPQELTATLAAVDAALGTPDPTRDAGKLAEQGPVQRQLRVLLWKHDVPEYSQPGLRTTELVDRLERKLFPPEKRP